VVIIFILAVALLSWLSRLPFLTINTVRVEGADPSLAVQLQSTATEAISGSYFGLFSKANAVIFPRGAVVNSIKESFLAVDGVEVHLNDLHQISVSVKQKVPDAIICFDFPALDTTPSTSPDTSDNCYDADKTGLVYGLHQSNNSSGLSKYYIPHTSEISSSTVIGTYATSTAEFLKLQSFYESARTAGLSVESVLIKDSGEYEMYIRNDDSTVAIVYFNNTRSFSDQLNNLVSFWNYMVTDRRADKKASSFDYMDVRYGSNVFYRENGGVASKK
jgi:hypothetical protein